MFWQCFQGEAVFPSSLVLSLPLLTFYDLARLMPSVPVKVVSVRGGEKCAGASPRDPSRRPGERPAIAANPTRMIPRGAARPPPHRRGITSKPGPGRLCGCGLPQLLGCAIFKKKRVVWPRYSRRNESSFPRYSRASRFARSGPGRLCGCGLLRLGLRVGLPFFEPPAGLRHMAPRRPAHARRRRPTMLRHKRRPGFCCQSESGASESPAPNHAPTPPAAAAERARAAGQRRCIRALARARMHGERGPRSPAVARRRRPTMPPCRQ